VTRYDQLAGIIARVRPSTIVEIGTHKGYRAAVMVIEALKHRSRVSYVGYDVFDTRGPEFQRRAFNGKEPVSRKVAEFMLTKLAQRYGARFTWNIVLGDTRETLHGKHVVADLVFIDGSHEVEVIRADYEAVKGSRCVVFDDYYVPTERGGTPNLAAYGANMVVDELPAGILPVTDSSKTGYGIRMAFVERGG
jgi:hypothetical protein